MESGCCLSTSQADAKPCPAAAVEASGAPLVAISILNWNGWYVPNLEEKWQIRLWLKVAH